MSRDPSNLALEWKSPVQFVMHQVNPNTKSSLKTTYPFGSIGTLVNRPQAMNAAMAPNPKLKPMAGNSLLEMWNIIASTITVTNPTADTGVSFGLILKMDGSNNPTAPRNSEIPMNRTNHSGMSFAHGTSTASWAIGVVDFMKPAIKNMKPNTIWAIQSEMFSTCGFFSVESIVLVVLVRQIKQYKFPLYIFRIYKADVKRFGAISTGLVW